MGIADRKDREKKERRERILTAADRLFKSKGYDGTSMAEIAEEVELSPATLYLYFPNKEVLHAAASLRITKSLLEGIENHGESDKGPEDTIEAMKEMLSQYYDTHKSVLLNVFRFQSSPLIHNLSPELADYIKEITAPTIRSLSETFRTGMEQGTFKRKKPVAVADVFWAVFIGLVIWEESKRALDPTKDHMKDTLDLAFELLAEGLKKKEETTE
jgi:AcrR family transcriptional regulator